MLGEGCFGTSEIICRSFVLKASKDSRSIAIKSILLTVFICFATNIEIEETGFENCPAVVGSCGRWLELWFSSTHVKYFKLTRLSNEFYYQSTYGVNTVSSKFS